MFVEWLVADTLNHGYMNLDLTYVGGFTSVEDIHRHKEGLSQQDTYTEILIFR